MVVLVHAPPLATPISSDLGREVGDPDVAVAVRQLPPGSLVLSGHIHDPRRWHARLGGTWCFNPGVDRSAEVPNHIVIDTGGKEATFRGWGKQIGPIRLD
jgi:Icc-related predicted phosphoesterase